MSRVDVSFLGRPLGTLAEARGGIVFEYALEFLARRIELSPFNLATRPGVLARGGTPTMRLPGLFEDSLPDAWGQRVLLAWFRAQKIAPHSVSALMQLSYLGRRTLGALTYAPALEVTAGGASLEAIFHASAELEASRETDLAVLAHVGSPAGGARPKAVLALAPDASGRVHLGPPEEAPSGFVPSIVKFDTADEGELGAMEEAYARLARAAGLDVPPTRLIETSVNRQTRRHFAVARFDRDAMRARIHYHSLAGLLEAGGGDLDYRHLLRATRRLARDEREVWKAFRQAVFNVLAENRDDHGKNVGFLLRDGEWKLAPAFDLTPLSRAQLPERGMAVLGERRAANASHLLALAQSESLDAARAREIVAEVRAAIERWREFADAAGVTALRAAEWEAELRRLR
ncbi:MAG: type II toxin-antitoxin system HipA family toxin [Opitutus sp.]|nr:type II toxin-antitoxin system HipA family toxin [Opitutus sp.]